MESPIDPMEMGMDFDFGAFTPGPKKRRERVRFYNEALQTKTGYRDVAHIEIYWPGKHDPDILRATDKHKRTYPEAWAAYEKQEKMEYDGTPLKMWPAINPASVKDFERYNVFTIEEVATLTDADKKRIGMTAEKFCPMAIQWMKNKEDNQFAEQLQKQKVLLEARLEEAEARIKQLAAKSDESEEKPKRKRRSSKNKTTEVE